MLRQLLDPDAFERMERQFQKIQEIDPKATLGIDVDFYVRSRKRRDDAAIARRQLMRTIQQQVSDFPDGMVTARGSGGTMVGAEVRIKEQRLIRLAIPTHPQEEKHPNQGDTSAESDQQENAKSSRTTKQIIRSSLLDFDDASEKMYDVHRQLISEARIGDEDNGKLETRR